MSGKLLLIMNPKAGTKKCNKYLADILGLFAAEGYECTVQMTTQYIRGKEIVNNYADGKDLIVCIGGDGTYNEIVSALMENKLDIPIGYIPAGSTNDFAYAMGISNDPLKAAKDIIDGEKTKIDIGIFNGRIFTYVVSFGAFTKSSYSTSRDLKNTLGHFAYILEGVKELADIKPFYLKVKTESAFFEGKYLFGAICNTTRIGGAVKIPKNIVDMNDGLFEIILVKSPSNPAEMLELLSDFQNFNKKSKMIEFFSASTCEIETEDTIDWSLDGEYQKGAEKIIIKNLKSSTTLMVNKK